MKKKIINGILMVALVSATSTSFVSCKDNSEDVKTDLVAALNKQAQDLTAAYQAADQALETSLQNWVVAQGYATKAQLADSIGDLRQWVKDNYVTHDSLNSYKNEVAAQFVEVGKRIDTLGLKIDTLKADVAQLKLDVDTLKNRMNAAEDSIKVLRQDITNIVETLKKMVTSVTVNATANSIISNSKLFPGINMQFVGAAYGEPDVKKGTFPTDFVDADLVKISEGKEYKWTDGDFINSNEDKFDAGKIYFTLNPSNVNPNSLKSLTLVNSKQEKIFDLGKVTECKEELNWGLTRTEFDANLWEAPVTYDATTLKALELKEIVDIKAIAKNVKNIINEAKGAAKDVNRSNYEDVTKATGKAVLKEAAQAVANLVNVKLPYMPAVALKATWADTVGTRSVLSDYSIAATAYKPMSFKEFDGVDFSGYSISFDKLDNAVLRVVNKIKAELNKFDLSKMNFSKITYDASGFKVNETVNLFVTYKLVGTEQVIDQIKLSKNATETGYTKLTSFTITKNFKDDIDAMIAAVNAGVPFDEINNIVAQVQNTINRVNNVADRAAKFEARVTNYLEYMIQRVLNNANRALEPILLVDGSNGMQRATGTYKAGKHTFVPTTVTYELVAPAFQKYIGVVGADGKARWGKVIAKGDKNFKATDVDLKAGDTQIVYSALDFKGNTITKVYNITVE
jgi:outer membrane murein-binding lipoprotein Lpp